MSNQPRPLTRQHTGTPKSVTPRPHSRLSGLLQDAALYELQRLSKSSRDASLRDALSRRSDLQAAPDDLQGHLLNWWPSLYSAHREWQEALARLAPIEFSHLQPGQLQWVGRPVEMPDGITLYIQPNGKGDSPCCRRWISPNRICPSLLNPICMSALGADNPAERWADPGDLEVAIALISTEPKLKTLMDGISAIHNNADIRHWRSEAQIYLLRTADLQRHRDNAAFAATLNKAPC